MPLSNCIFEKVFEFVYRKKIAEKCLKHLEVNLSAIESVDLTFPSLMKSHITYYSSIRHFRTCNSYR